MGMDTTNKNFSLFERVGDNPNSWFINNIVVVTSDNTLELREKPNYEGFWGLLQKIVRWITEPDARMGRVRETLIRIADINYNVDLQTEGREYEEELKNRINVIENLHCFNENGIAKRNNLTFSPIRLEKIPLDDKINTLVQNIEQKLVFLLESTINQKGSENLGEEFDMLTNRLGRVKSLQMPRGTAFNEAIFQEYVKTVLSLENSETFGEKKTNSLLSEIEELQRQIDIPEGIVELFNKKKLELLEGYKGEKTKSFNLWYEAYKTDFVAHAIWEDNVSKVMEDGVLRPGEEIIRLKGKLSYEASTTYGRTLVDLPKLTNKQLADLKILYDKLQLQVKSKDKFIDYKDFIKGLKDGTYRGVIKWLGLLEFRKFQECIYSLGGGSGKLSYMAFHTQCHQIENFDEKLSELLDALGDLDEYEERLKFILHAK